jgi:hypothetical protein
LYDPEIIAASPQKFEKHPQEFSFREKAPCKNESQLNGHLEQGAMFIASRQML